MNIHRTIFPPLLFTGMLLGEHTHHKPRRTVTALRPAARSHRFLYRCQMTRFRQRFHRINFLAGYCRKRHQTTVNRSVSSPVNAVFDKQYRAGATLTLRTAFLGARQAPRPDVVEQRHLGCSPGDSRAFSIENELETGAAACHGQFYSIMKNQGVTLTPSSNFHLQLLSISDIAEGFLFVLQSGEF
jgi:hypothetical protein